MAESNVFTEVLIGPVVLNAARDDINKVRTKCANTPHSKGKASLYLGCCWIGRTHCKSFRVQFSEPTGSFLLRNPQQVGVAVLFTCVDQRVNV